MSDTEWKVRLLDDQPVDEDAFGGHRRVARAIAELIRSEDGGKAIAIEGGWGSGKSSVIRMVERELVDDCVHLMVFDAWSHEGDPLRRVFLEELSAECFKSFDAKTKKKWEVEKHERITGYKRETTQTTEPILRSKWPIFAIALAALYPVAVVALGGLLRQEWNWIIETLIALSAILALLPTGLLFFLFIKCRGENEEWLKKAAQWISIWDKKVSSTISTTAHESIGPTSIEFQKYFSGLLAEYEKGVSHRIVLVFDNLDRVPDATAKQLWATLRLFAECCERHGAKWSKRVWFLVPYDRASAAALWEGEGGKGGRVVNAMESADSRIGTSDILSVRPASVSAAFLDKTFQVRFGVPPLHIADWEAYLNDLLRQALPGIGTEEQHQRVYRLSARLSDEKGRPPSPRHLKLYVNDIGALVRQFGNAVHLDHMALYTLLARQGCDVRVWVQSGQFKVDPLARLMPDDTFVESLLAIYFGTTDFDRAKTLTLAGPLRSALRNGDGEALRKLAQVPGFWIIAQRELEEENLEQEDLKQDIVVNIANALRGSGLAQGAPVGYSKVVANFAAKVLRGAAWSQLNNRSAEAAAALIQIVRTEEIATVAIGSLISGEKPGAPTVASDAKDWVVGVKVLVEAVRALGYRWHVSVPGEAKQVVGCLAAIGAHENFPTEITETLTCKSTKEAMQEAVAIGAEQVWSQEHINAVTTLRIARNIEIEWSVVIDAMVARVLVQELEAKEFVRLSRLLFVLYELAPEAALKGMGRIAAHVNYYTHVARYQNDELASAWLVALALLAKQVGRAAQADSEKPGLAVIQSWRAFGTNAEKVVKGFKEIIFNYPALPLMERLIDQRDSMGKMATHLLFAFAESDGVGRILSAATAVDQWEALEGVLGEKSQTLIENALKTDSFLWQLSETPVTEATLNAHWRMAKSGAIKDEKYRQRVSAQLSEWAVGDWVAEIQNPGNRAQLLALAIQSGISVPAVVAQAFEQIGLGLCDDGQVDVQWSELPSVLSEIYFAIDRNQRRTTADRIVDQLAGHDLPKGLQNAVMIFGEDLTGAFAARRDESLVRRTATPILQSRDFLLLDWLVKVSTQGLTWWEGASDANKEVFRDALLSELHRQDGEDDLMRLLEGIARNMKLDVTGEAEGARNSGASADEEL